MDPSELLAAVERFLSDTGMTPTQFGWQAVKDPVFVRDLKNGREPRRRTRQRVADFIAQYRKAA